MCRLVVLMVLCALAGSGFASDSGWQVTAVISAGRANIDHITDHDTIGTGQVIVGLVDGQIAESSTHDTVAGIGIALGRSIGAWNLELETMWRYRTDWDLTVPTPSIRTLTNVFTNIETTSILLNAVRERPLSGPWSYELGVGLGLVWKRTDSSYIERDEPSINFLEQIFDDKNSELDFAWNLIAGVKRELTGPWSLGFRYRYVDLGRLNVGPYPSRNSRVSGDHASHELLIAISRSL